jgi:general secretion pathway protein D
VGAAVTRTRRIHSVIRRSGSARVVRAALAAGLLVAGLGAGAASAQRAPAGATPAESPRANGQELIQLDFNNVELAIVIDTIAKLTGKNFIYDDRVRGRVTVVSPTKITVDEAYAVFESVLQVKGFTTVPTPGGALKVIPMRDAKETSVPTDQSSRPPENRDLFITRLIPLQYIDAESIVNTLKPLVSKDAAIAAYQPTNTVILTESASNIRRLIAIIQSIDVDTYREDLALIHLEYADAATMAQQLSDIYGVEVAGAQSVPSATRTRRATPTTPQATQQAQSPLRNVRIITDERTNSLIVLAARAQIEEVRNLARKLDVPVSGGGRVHVYYLQHADAEELAQTLNALISGAPAAPTGAGGAGGTAAGQAQALRTVVAGLAEGVTVTADPPTNSLVIQASQEGFAALAAVIEKLDIERPQVLVEALIMEVDINDGRNLGFDGLYRLVTKNTDIVVASNTAGRALGAAAGGAIPASLPAFLGSAIHDTIERDADGNIIGTGSAIQAILTASANDDSVNVISAPHILTSDNEEAEIRVGDNIPIITSRVQSAQGITTTPDGSLATSVNVERQDIGVTLRVTPQITEGETLRLEIFQEITQFNNTLTEDLSSSSGQSGPALTSRKVENTVVVADGEMVVIGGILADVYEDNVTKVPWLGDIPVLGWAFKTERRMLRKTNLLVFLTPHIVRTEADLERETIRKREEFRQRTDEALRLDDEESEREVERRRADLEQGAVLVASANRHPARDVLLNHEARYPLERMSEIEARRDVARREKEAAARRGGTRYVVQATVLGDEQAAMETLTRLVDAGYDGTLVSAQVGGRVVYEVRVGPYDELADAQRAGEAIRRSEGLAPALIVEPPEPEPEPEPETR